MMKKITKLFTIYIMGLSYTCALANNYSNIDLTQHTAVVDIGKSELCVPTSYRWECYPVLIGKDTPKGTFNLNIYKTSLKGYGGEVLGFHQEGRSLFAVHRVWLGNPSEKRDSRIKSDNVADRLITNGCININEKGYQAARKMLVLRVK